MILTEGVYLPCELMERPVLSRTVATGDMRQGSTLLRLLIRRSLCCTECTLSLAPDGGRREYIPMEYGGIMDGRDMFFVNVTLPAGLYYFTYELNTALGKRYVSSAGDEQDGQLYENEDYCSRFQLMLCREDISEKCSLHGSCMYHIFVDRFKKTEKFRLRPGAKFEPDWDGGIPEYGNYPGDSIENNTFFGGDLYGIAEKLPYIRSLGADIIYLSPIFTAYSNHRYDTADYTRVEPAIGGEEGLACLIERAKALGIRLVLDGVFNHVGKESVYFGGRLYGGSGATDTPDSPYRDWFYFNSYPDDYECWWGVKVLPKLKSDHPEVQKLISGHGGVIDTRIKMGVSGFRLDVADELCDGMLDSIKARSLAADPDSFIIGEVWEDASNKTAYGKRRSYFINGQLDSVMNYPLRDGVISFVKGCDAEGFAGILTVLMRHYPKRVLFGLMNFLGTHDTERILTVLAGEPAGGRPGDILKDLRLTDEQYERGRNMLDMAFALLCLCPGVPCVYYGDEAGCQGYRDPFCRMPFPWGNEDMRIFESFQKTLKYRSDHPAVKYGDTEILYAGGGALSIARYTDDERVIGLFNSSDKEITFATGGICLGADGKTYGSEVTLSPMTYIYLEETQ